MTVSKTTTTAVCTRGTAASSRQAPTTAMISKLGSVAAAAFATTSFETTGAGGRPKRRVRSSNFNSKETDAVVAPLELLQSFLGDIPSCGGTCDLSRPFRRAFETPEKEQIDEYTIALLSLMAKCTNPSEELRASQLGARNKFGVTLLHKACRYPNWVLARFLCEQRPDLCLAVDDLGRNALHDACWNEKVDFDVIDLLVSQDAANLVTPDTRGHTPLCFAPEAAWPAWKKYLTSNRQFLVDAIARARADDVEMQHKLTASTSSSSLSSASSS